MSQTGYEHFSQTQLFSLFSAENWNTMDLYEKIAACQEVENRYAEEKGVEPCNVVITPMDGAAYGQQNGKLIFINSYLLENGEFRTSMKQYGENYVLTTPVGAPGWNVLETVYHEGTHGIQESNGVKPKTYITPDKDPDLYRIQGIEKEAFETGQMKTVQALLDYESSTGHLDIGRYHYFADVNSNSYQLAVQRAASHYNDPSIETTLQNVIDDREHYNIRENPSESYRAINDLCNGRTMQQSVSTEISSEESGISEPITLENVDAVEYMGDLDSEDSSNPYAKYMGVLENMESSYTAEEYTGDLEQASGNGETVETMYNSMDEMSI